MGFQAWQFYVNDTAYGAKGDGKVLGDVVTNSTTTITSATANFSAADVGKHIMIHGAQGTTSGPLITTIASVTSPTAVVLAAAATATVSNCPAVYGTDDTAAIQAAINAAKAYAVASGYSAEVVFGPFTYIIAAAPVQTTTPAHYNAQLTIPYPDLTGNGRKLDLALVGAGDAGYCQYWEALVPNVTGSALVTMQNPTAANANNATFGQQSVIGGPSAGGAFTGGFANTKLTVSGLSVWCPIFTNVYAYDAGFLGAFRAEQSSAHIFAPPGVNASAVLPLLSSITAVAFTNSIGSGFRTPTGGNNADITASDCTVEGYECAWRVSDHFTADRIAAIYSDVVMKWDSTQGVGGTQHGLFIQNMTAENYNGGLLSNGGACQVDIEWDSETATPTYDVSDAGNAFFGTLRYGDKVDNRAPILSGGSNLKVINKNLAPGHWAGAPAAPATTVSQQNTAWRDAWIVLSATTGITVITVDGTTTGLTAGNAVPVAVRVPSGKSYAVTYTGVLTATWWLD